MLSTPTVTSTPVHKTEEHPIKKMQCWKPDPQTGMWKPEDTSVAGVVDDHAVPTTQDRRVRTLSGASIDDRVWWASLEEIPEQMYKKPKA